MAVMGWKRRYIKRIINYVQLKTTNLLQPNCFEMFWFCSNFEISFISSEDKYRIIVYSEQLFRIFNKDDNTRGVKRWLLMTGGQEHPQTYVYIYISEHLLLYSIKAGQFSQIVLFYRRHYIVISTRCLIFTTTLLFSIFSVRWASPV